MDLRPLTDAELLTRLASLASSERELVSDVVEHLVEVERRGAALDLAYPSLYAYCREKLRYSEFAALARIRAARAARDFPEVLGKLRDGSLHLDAVARLYPHLTEENSTDILTKASGATSRAVMAIVADLKGIDPPKPDRIVPLALPRRAEQPLAPQEIIPPPRRLRLEFEADEGLVLRIERLKSLLRNKYPFARLEEVFRDASEALLDKIDPERRAPARSAPSTGGRSRHIPAAIKRQVWRRDGGRCAFVAEDGRRCESTHALQYDHVTPWALGGPSDDPQNIRLLCRPHNLRLARKRFGPRPR